MIVNDFFQALRAGKELSNAQTWKDAQQAANSLTALLAAGIGIAAFAGYPVPLTPDQISSLVNGFLVVLGLFNWAATAVSTKRVGLLPCRFFSRQLPMRCRLACSLLEPGWLLLPLWWRVYWRRTRRNQPRQKKMLPLHLLMKND